ncbi:hypothetical protein AVV12_gp77 [Streptomyces phage SF3]|uniref:Uncharacterized protein n=1 Tax=Streptomyces phage SF3 TaxID=1690818 RepID=A0A0M5M2X0_9CAUD|nr:hypothetical protein AVV12_gp77 [Streptomyces phage SF3]ALF00208.1 hypothetical protein SF3_780 [Streptomyces phage SF3]
MRWKIGTGSPSLSLSTWSKVTGV